MSLDEWLQFWQAVLQAGHSEQEILTELDAIKNGESWVGFQNMPAKYQQHAKMHNRNAAGTGESAD